MHAYVRECLCARARLAHARTLSRASRASMLWPAGTQHAPHVYLFLDLGTPTASRGHILVFSRGRYAAPRPASAPFSRGWHAAPHPLSSASRRWRCDGGRGPGPRFCAEVSSILVCAARTLAGMVLMFVVGGLSRGGSPGSLWGNGETPAVGRVARAPSGERRNPD